MNWTKFFLILAATFAIAATLAFFLPWVIERFPEIESIINVAGLIGWLATIVVLLSILAKNRIEQNNLEFTIKE